MLGSKLKKFLEGGTQHAVMAAIAIGIVLATGEQALAASGTSPFAGVEKLGNNTLASLGNLVSIGAVIGATVLVLVAIATKKWNSGWMWTIIGGLVFIAALPQAIPWIQSAFTAS